MSAEVEFEYTGKGYSVPKDVTIVRFHPSVIEVRQYAFYDCKQLREVIFNDGLQKIGWNAFRNCTSLSSIALPSTVTEIGEYAFSFCNKLRDVTFNDGLQKIGAWSLGNCTLLSSIVLPSTLTEIGRESFFNCLIVVI